MNVTKLAVVLALLSLPAGCGENYHCQSGAKYGTQCYRHTDNQWRSEEPTKGRTVWRPKKRPAASGTASGTAPR
jgi:hypothetical protein